MLIKHFNLCRLYTYIHANRLYICIYQNYDLLVLLVDRVLKHSYTEAQKTVARNLGTKYTGSPRLSEELPRKRHLSSTKRKYQTEATPQVVWPIAKSFIITDCPKALPAIHGISEFKFHPMTEDKAIEDFLEHQFAPQDLCDYSEWRVEARAKFCWLRSMKPSWRLLILLHIKRY